MNVQINQLVKSLLKKDNLDQCSLQELEQFAERHPYFGAAQLLLTKKLQEEKSDRYDEQLQKTFLFFNNPLWVQHLLNETGTAEIVIKEKKQDQPEEILVDTTEKENDSAPFFELKVDEPAPDKSIISESILREDVVITNELHTIIVEEDHVIEPPSPPLDPEKKDGTNELNPKKEELLFEPYHMVDYFASQGIKYNADEKVADQLGRQLKSFTDWLRTMKKLPLSEIGKSVTTFSEKKVEQLAQHSLDEKEVITEAMAEVWEKQGNKEKAIEVYTKLSLLDPSKNLYFAAKIDDLKQKN